MLERMKARYSVRELREALGLQYSPNEITHTRDTIALR